MTGPVGKIYRILLFAQLEATRRVTMTARAVHDKRAEIGYLSGAAWLAIFCAFSYAPLTRHAEGATTQAPCIVVELGSYPLRLDSSAYLLISPEDAARSSSGSVFFGGSRNYVMPNLPPAETQFIGAIADSVGISRLVTVPMATDSLESVHVTALPDGTWAAAFFEVAGEPDRFPRTKHLWHGLHDGTRWTQLDSIPIPADVEVDFTDSSRLLYRGNTLIWAVGTDVPDEALVFERELPAGDWQVTRLAGHVNYLDLAYQEDGELLIAVVGPDPAFARAEGLMSFGGSIYVRSVHRPDLATRRPATYPDDDIHQLGFMDTPDGPLLVWTATSSGNFRQGNLRAAYVGEQSIGPVFNIADSVVLQPPLIIPPGDGLPLIWVTEHDGTGEGSRRLRFWQRVDGEVTEIATFPDSYLMTVTSAAWPGRVLIMGDEAVPRLGGMPVSVLRSFQIVCVD